MAEIMLKANNISKKYILGQIGGTTLVDELHRINARLLKKEDPTKRIGSVSYKKGETFLALEAISFEVKKGERVGIIGHNGAGKSTLLKLISRVTAPTTGKIGLNGRVASMLEVGTGFHQELTGRENIYMNGAILGMTKKEIDSKIDAIIDFSECRQFIDTPVKRYSSGMYVRLAFSVAAHLDSEIMIMDEVLAVGDTAFQKKCLDKMNSVSKEEGRTILYVSHNMNTIRQLCNRVIVLNHGHIVFDGDVENGIDVYSSGGGEGFPLLYDLSKCKRPSNQHGVELVANSFEFIGNDQAIFNRSEKIKFKISFKTNREFEDLKIYLAITSTDGTIIGMTQSYEGINRCYSDHMYTCLYEVDFSNIAEGDYYFYLDIFSDNGEGKHYSVDHPMQEIRFRIIEDCQKGLDWLDRNYGHIKLNEAVLIEGNEVI